MSFHFVLFFVCRSCLHLLFFKIYFFIVLAACGIKLTSTFFQILSSSSTQVQPGDDYEIYFSAADPRRLHIWTILRKDEGKLMVQWPASKHPPSLLFWSKYCVFEIRLPCIYNWHTGLPRLALSISFIITNIQIQIGLKAQPSLIYLELYSCK